jgi:hypothetical protein
MDKLETYRQHIQQVLQSYTQKRPTPEGSELQVLFDTHNDHYQLMVVGWQQSKREYWIVAHIDLKNGQIWIQADSTETGLTNGLLELGVPKQDIVLGFQAPFKRAYSEFGTGQEVAA